MSKKIEFKDQYKHPLWQKKRLEILERDDYKCCDCKASDKQLHVHHGYYERDVYLWEYGSDTLWTLCADCHERWGKYKKAMHIMIARIKLEEFNSSEVMNYLYDYSNR